MIKKTTGYKPRSHQNDFRIQSMTENDKLAQKENFSLHCVQNIKKKFGLYKATGPLPFTKKVLESNVLPWFKKIPKKSDFSTGRSAGTYGKDCARLGECKHELLIQRLLATTVTRLEPPRFQLMDAH